MVYPKVTKEPIISDSGSHWLRHCSILVLLTQTTGHNIMYTGPSIAFSLLKDKMYYEATAAQHTLFSPVVVSVDDSVGQ